MSEPTKKPAEAKKTKEEKASAWATAIETIAGDNKMMSTVLKVVLSPIGIVAALCGIGYLLWKNKTYQDKIKELEEDLHDAQLEVSGLEKDVEYLKKGKRPKYREDEDEEDEDEERRYRVGHVGFLPLQPLSSDLRRSEKRKNIYLD